MNLFPLIRPLLFKFQPETSHNLALNSLKLPLISQIVKAKLPDYSRSHKSCFGLQFKHPLGLAAGFDKNAEYVDQLGRLGFAFIEIGTVTYKEQSGNPKPRVFRLIKDKAILNRMGFNNDGAHRIAKRLEKRKSDIIIGGNIGKNKDTAIESASEDYSKCFNILADLVDYFVVNVSSPNTANLRDLQAKEPLEKLLETLQNENQKRLEKKPLLLKIAPDMPLEQLAMIAEVLSIYQFDGCVINNTSTRRDLLTYSNQEIEQFGTGGISGSVIHEFSNSVLAEFRKISKLPVIAVGGIMSGTDAKRKMEFGADLIQIYTGFIYKGPDLIREILESICD